MNQYPDANSTLRLSYGKVSTFPRDGQMLAYQSFASEILAKENSSYDFRLKDDWRSMETKNPWPRTCITWRATANASASISAMCSGYSSTTPECITCWMR